MTKNDMVVLCTGTNDIAKNCTDEGLNSIVKFIQDNKQTNFIVLEAPHRHDLVEWSCINQEVKRFNRKLGNRLKLYEHVSVVSVQLERSDFTRHGLHMNSKGKNQLCETVADTIKKEFSSTESAAIELTGVTTRTNIDDDRPGSTDDGKEETPTPATTEGPSQVLMESAAIASSGGIEVTTCTNIDDDRPGSTDDGKEETPTPVTTEGPLRVSTRNRRPPQKIEELHMRLRAIRLERSRKPDKPEDFVCYEDSDDEEESVTAEKQILNTSYNFVDFVRGREMGVVILIMMVFVVHVVLVFVHVVVLTMILFVFVMLLVMSFMVLIVVVIHIVVLVVIHVVVLAVIHLVLVFVLSL
ncbi:hypothetical protein ANN_18734 [Periplaneta americana]|uniref:Uncharacterized protein n=1 Tax=Periplaneta americana TaxID=6978 RepID=A0ABQ8SPL3_PERAM|nr:hypothetical protein ANN_18734 [Periplaneta americana]